MKAPGAAAPPAAMLRDMAATEEVVAGGSKPKGVSRGVKDLKQREITTGFVDASGWRSTQTKDHLATEWEEEV